MLNKTSIKDELIRVRNKTRTEEDRLIDEVNRILNSDLLQEANVLNNLKFYNKSFELLDDEQLDTDMVFKLDEIKAICVRNRLRFLDSCHFKNEIPVEAILKIKNFNDFYSKDLKGFKILSTPENFCGKRTGDISLLFIPTLNGNYFLAHSWGQELSRMKKWSAFPLRNFETLSLTLAVLTLMITLVLPTRMITLDHEATYWCGYRIATYFHILIFNCGVTAYFTFAFNKNFSGMNWDSHHLSRR